MCVCMYVFVLISIPPSLLVGSGWVKRFAMTKYIEIKFKMH